MCKYEDIALGSLFEISVDELHCMRCRRLSSYYGNAFYRGHGTISYTGDYFEFIDKTFCSYCGSQRLGALEPCEDYILQVYQEKSVVHSVDG